MKNCYSPENNSEGSYISVWKGALKCKKSFLLMLILLISITTCFGQIFEDRGNTVEQWNILDWRGDARVYPTTDPSCPPGYGPGVLHIEGGVVLGMAKGHKMSEGTFVALYRENEPRDKDADGIIMVKSAYDLDISIAHNTKEERPHVWLEQDNDCGIQLRFFNAAGKEENLAERCGFGVVTDPWNRTNWIWQKVTIKGNMLYAKTWPAHEGEPEEWALEAVYKSGGERFGFKINSGNINLAYFAADTGDISIKVPSTFLYAPLMHITRAKEIAFTLFTNRLDAVEQNLKISVLSNGKSIAESSVNLNIPSGYNEFRISLSTETVKTEELKINIHLPKEPMEGPLQLVLSDLDGHTIAERMVSVLPVRRIRERFAARGKTIKLIGDVLAKGEKNSQAYKAVMVIHDAAKSHLDHTIALFDGGDIDGSDRTFRFVDETLGELGGYKKAFLTELDPDMNLSIAPWDENDRRGVGPPPERGFTDAYSMRYLLSFGNPEINAQSMVMGRTYNVTIPWKIVGGVSDKDYRFEVRVVSPLGHRVVARSTTGPDIPTSQWKPGNTYLQHVKLSISPEDPAMGKGRPEQPAVLDEYHYLLISVIDPETGAKLILGNAPGPQPERVGQSFCAGDFYISSSPLEISKLSSNDGVAGNIRNDSVTISNVGKKNLKAGVLFSVNTASGQLVYQDYKPLSVIPGKAVSVQFRWESNWAGELYFQIRLVKNGKTLTEAKRKMTIALPDGVKIAVSKANHVKHEGGKFYTPIRVDCGTKKAEVFVFADGRLVGSAKGSPSIEVNTEPWFGYYDVIVNMGKYSYSERIIATVVETKGMDMIVNGEPFLIKGVNVHGLSGRSPEHSASMMRIMRELGFNAWRGDYPPLWQMALAYELNSFYTVLGPFSCISTEEIFARQAGPPMATARALSHLLVERYKHSAGVLLWNSCNEIEGEKEDFLNTLKPVFKAHDPYNRPVHYSNLFGQDLYQGQDVMGINYYFGAGQSAKDRQPVIQRSINIARNNNIPIMYNEFNSYAGAIHSTGVEAMYGLYEWGIEQGMCGGFQYMKGNSTSHPGIFDDGYNTHKIYDEAIIDVLADAEIILKNMTIEDGKVILQVRNKRRFTLRQVRMTLTASGMKLKPVVLSDMAPQSIQDVILHLPDVVKGPAVTLEGHIECVTHYGFKSKVPVSLIAIR